MGDTNSDLQSKINRAIRALLMAAGAAVVGDTYAPPDGEGRTLPNTTVETLDGMEMTECPGLWRFPQVLLNLRDEAVAQPDEPSANAMWVAANARFSRIVSALTQTDTGTDYRVTAVAITQAGNALAVSDGTPEGDQRAKDNADMADFTIQYWRPVSLPGAKKTGSDKETFWERELTFECVACGAAVG